MARKHPLKAASYAACSCCHWDAQQVLSGESQLRGQGLLPFDLPMPGEKFVQPGLRHLGDAIEDVGEPGLRVDVVELCGADERVHDSGPHAAAIRPGEEPRFASETDAAQRPLGGVGNGGEKLVHGSGGIVSLRAEQNSAT